MKLRTLGVAFAMMGLALAVTAGAQEKKAAPAEKKAAAMDTKSADPLSGTWAGDWGPSASDRNQVTVEIKYDGKAVSGTVNPGPNAVMLQKSTFDAKTGAVHMEADSKNRKGDTVHFVIDGKVDGSTMSGSWNHDARKGDFKITKK